MKRLSQIALSSMIALSLNVAHAEEKSEEVKVEKQQSGLSLLFPNGFAEGSLSAGYSKKTDDALSINENVGYSAGLVFGTPIGNTPITFIAAIPFSKGVHQREITLGNISVKTEIPVYAFDGFFSSKAAYSASLPTANGADSVSNYLSTKGTLYKKLASVVGNFTPAFTVSASTQFFGSEQTTTVEKEGAGLGPDGKKITEEVSVAPQDLGMYYEMSVTYANDKLKGFSNTVIYSYSNGTKANGVSSASFSAGNATSYGITDKLAVSNYASVGFDGDHKLDEETGFMGGFSDSVSLSYAF